MAKPIEFLGREEHGGGLATLGDDHRTAMLFQPAHHFRGTRLEIGDGQDVL
jgi:hypothetical protein